MNRETILAILGGSVILAFYTLLFIKLTQGQNIEIEVGVLVTAFAGILGFYFGSSQGSKDKDNK